VHGYQVVPLWGFVTNVLWAFLSKVLCDRMFSLVSMIDLGLELLGHVTIFCVLWSDMYR
jgi:hypothetical protein